MDPGAVRVGRMLEGEDVPDPAEVVAVMLVSSAVGAYEPGSARRWLTSIRV